MKIGSVTTPLDNLTYIYKQDVHGNEINQLDHVADALGQVAGVDLPDQGSGNYAYDLIGQLLSDETEHISEIKWTVTNKVKEVIYDGPLAGKKIVFDYNSMGNRIAKHVTLAGVTNSTYYVLDAQGNPMSIYSRQSDENILYLAERNLYGSSRIGMEEHNMLMASEALSNTENLVSLDFNSGESSLGWPFQSACSAGTTQVNVSGSLKVTDPCAAQHDLFVTTVPGHYYEFSADFDLTNASNFFILSLEHAAGCGAVTSSQNLNVTTGNQFLHGFTATTNCSRISFRNIGTGGSPGGTFIVDNIQLKHWLPEVAPENELVDNISGDKRYELANHLGNVLNVVTDRKLPEESSTDVGTVAYYLSDVVSYSDYDPFGMMLEGRHGSAGYRFGFNGMEADNEVKGDGNSYDFGARMLDPRLGRWLSIDPLAAKYPSLSPYNFVANNPILFIDPNGKDIEFPSIQRGEDGTIIIEMKITAKLVNESIWPVLNEVHMKDLAERGSAALKEIYGITGDYIELVDDFGNEISGNFKVNVTVDLSVASEANPVTAKDHVVYIASHGRIPHSKEDAEKTQMESAGSTVLGYSPDGYKVIYLSNKILENKPVLDEDGKMINGRDVNGDDSFERTISHEFGHRGGLIHAEDSPLRTTRDNLMREGREVERGIKLEPIQLEVIIEESRSGTTNSGSNKLD